MGGSYGVSKHGVLALAVQAELEQQGANVRAGVLCPGFVDTQILRPSAIVRVPSKVKSILVTQFEAAKAMLASEAQKLPSMCFRR